MRKNLLTLGILCMSIPFNAQFISSIGDKALVTVKAETLLYNGGSLITKGSGVLDVYGNIMVSGDTSNVFQTLNTAGSGAKTDGGNIILRMDNAANTRYGQLAILGLTNANITGIVDKEYREAKHGSYQQIAIPFNAKLISSLSSEFGKTFTNTRYSQDEILTWNNPKVRSDVIAVSTAISNATEYYMLGSKNINPALSAVTVTNPNVAINTIIPVYTPGTFVVRGRPFDDISRTVELKDAGKDIDFGTNGTNVNYYREKYNTYLQDSWAYSSGVWTGNYGKNIYQFGNPFLTNLDLKYIGVGETGGDGNFLTKLVGVRVDPGTVTTEANGSTYSTAAKYITYASGVATGDVSLSIIKPMQTFVVKLNDNLSTGADISLNFNTLRRFKYDPRTVDTYTGPTSNRISANNTVKQLGVIALDADGQEMGRCYYVVYANGKSGKPVNTSTQVTNTSTNVIGTYEEDAVNGGYDNSLTNSYWLYINEANETDFKGKSVPLNLYSSNIKSLKFEIRENAELIEDGQQELSSGKEFYYQLGNNDVVPIKNGQVIPVSSDQYGLFYDKPDSVLGSNDAKPSRTKVIYNSNIDDYVVLFDPNWKQADVKIYDASGKLITSKSKVSAKNEYVLNVQKTNGVYVVVVTSEKGETVNTKIIR